MNIQQRKSLLMADSVIPASVPHLRRNSPADAQKHDCGRLGMLTVRQICEASGQKPSTIYARISKGWTGSILASKRQPSRAPGRPRTDGMVLACQIGIVAAHNDRLLSTKEIIGIKPMSRQAAERWRCALRVAMKHVRRYVVLSETGI